MVEVVGSTPIAPTRKNKHLWLALSAFFIPGLPVGEKVGEKSSFV